MNERSNALRAGLAAPDAATNDDAQAGANGLGIADHETGLHDSAADAAADQDRRVDDGDHKVFATLRAKLALHGYSLCELSDGSLLVHRWNLSRPLADLRAVSCFLRQIGALA